ncbi:response regulator [Gloeobacter kilaueensis]|uniref:Two component LuxR family transcriptional regulator n=1 Tax=Gloeobacter kilaueensis (strain ATCC BAA-2537 / CCAP 1431/1 / ULC 316 / JS1) TaxID=1183438 RepID=U5QJC4_GLOK1|nr:response regulator transcription factor [Gloeobacter kilaueensis]AGY58968.1 two component LuxR family transcriptional regulator [Gloeobacter kilaueensis JS1]
MASRPTVLLVEDDPVFRMGLSLLLKSSPRCVLVGEVEDGESALKFVRRQPVQVVLLDIGLPGLGGEQTLRQLKQSHPEIKVLVLTSRDEARLVQKMVQAGADGYCLKGIAPEHLLRVIEEVSAGHGWFDSKVLAELREALGSAEQNLAGPTQTVSLSEREREVLQWIARGASNPEIGRHLHISSGTVRVHVHAILSKLGASDRTQAAVIAIERGLLPYNSTEQNSP